MKSGFSSALLCLLVIGSCVSPAYGQAQFSYSKAPLRDVLTDIQKREAYHFLYRDALISNKTVSLQASSNELLASLEEALVPHQLGMRVDATHKQVLLFETEAQARARQATITGQILDDEHGTRLPFANIIWKTQAGSLRGVSSNEAGVFVLPITDEMWQRPSLRLTISYLGYRSYQITLDLSEPIPDLAIRLTPEPIASQELLISSSILDTGLDTSWHHLIDASLYAPFGESSVIRSLESLPSVAISGAVSDGLNVRGSKGDGFNILLDGAPIYNQQHFYGLFDAFNDDALQTVGFYYDVAPARYFAPPGGTLSFVTRTGSQTQMKATLGVSNTALRGTFEGPLADGKGSWLVSGRQSYFSSLSWLLNDRLVNMGLDVNRETSELPGNLEGFEERTVFPGPSEVSFYDVHSKLYLESKKGARNMLTIYLGGNHTRLDSDRIVFQSNNGRFQPTMEPQHTQNDWGNEAVSYQLQHPFGRNGYLQTILALSHYRSEFNQTDFLYTRFNRTTQRLENRIFPFLYENVLLNAKWAHHLTASSSPNTLWSAGIEANYYALSYEEASLLRLAFKEEYFAIQTDAYGEVDYSVPNILALQAGLRTHYFTQGPRFKFSPRIQLTLAPDASFSARGGYSRNYQFLHHLSLENTNSASVWIMSTGSSQPSSVDNFTAGIYGKLSENAFVQLEGYQRIFKNLRQHEINGPAQLTTANSDRFVPWFTENTAHAQGIEAMYRQRMGPLLWSSTYTLSQVELQNELVNNGNPYPAEWDRRHQVTSHLQASLGKALTLHLNWSLASGAFNPLSLNADTEPERLPTYHRVDAALRLKSTLDGSVISAGISVYNLFDQQNTWYRDPVQTFNPDAPLQGFRYTAVSVYDLGLQPAFDISVTF